MLTHACFLKRYSFCLVLIATLLYPACDSKKRGQTDQIVAYELEIVDSISVNRLSEVLLMDYNEQTEELLLHDTQTNEILVIDQQGQLVSSFNPFVEGPDYIGSQSYGWNFFEQDKIVAYGQVHFHLLSKQGKRLARREYPVEVSSWWSLDYNPKMLFTFEHQSNTEVLALIPGVMGPHFKSQAFQDSVNMIYTVNFDNAVSRAVFQKQESSIYRKLGKYVDRGWPTISKIQGSTFAVMYSVDSLLYIFDARENKLIRKISTPEEYQPKFEPVSFGSSDTPDRFRINTRIFSTGDQIVVEAMDKIPESELNKIQRQPEWWESQELKEALDKYTKSHFLIFDKNQFLGRLEWNAGKINYDVIGSENGYLWFQRRYDDERDYHTFLKMKIVPLK